MKKRSLFMILALVLAMSVVLVACSNDANDEADEAEDVEVAEEVTEEAEDTEEDDDAEEAGEYKDGVYTVEGEKGDKGWQYVVEVTIEDGKVADVNIESVAHEDFEDGSFKEGDTKTPETYEYEPYFETVEAIEKEVVDKNGVEDLDLDGVSGATNTQGDVIKLIEEALEEASN